MVGLHMDCHVAPDYPLSPAMYPETFERMLDAMQPDYMQCDTKGHPGYSSYPTRAGTPAPDMNFDMLRTLRNITMTRGIALFAHYSSLFDMQVVVDHPDWAVVGEDGTRSTHSISVFSPYTDEILIPQLLEIAVDYELDGAWVDAECWAVEVDYSRYAREAWKRKTGSEHCPGAGEAGLNEYRDFCRQGFRDYVKHYIAAVKAVKPEFQITSNWIFSGHMPERPTIPVDFLSGDFLPRHALSSGRCGGRIIMAHGMPWDLMSWGMSQRITRDIDAWPSNNRSLKEANQLCQEAAEVIALGGGYQFYLCQLGVGIAPDWLTPDCEAVAEFCRAREPYCFHAKPIQQIAVLYSDEASRCGGNKLFKATTYELYRCVTGIFDLCANCQLTTDAILSYQVEDGLLAKYGMLLVPDCNTLENVVISAIVDYARNGGRVLLCGAAVTALFSDAFAIGIEPVQSQKLICLEYNGRLAGYKGNAADFTQLDGWDVMYQYRQDNAFVYPARPAIVKRSFGKGVLCAMNFDLGDLYSYNMTKLIRDVMKDIADRLYPERIVRVEGSMFAEATLMQKDGRMMLNLLNAIDFSGDTKVRTYSEIPVIGPLAVSLRLDKCPKRIWQQPENRVIDFTWEDNRVCFTVPRLEIHSVYCIEL